MEVKLWNQAIKAARKASEEILKVRQEGFDINYKTDKSPVTMADVKASDVIIDILSTTNIPLIGEEIINQNFEYRKDWPLVWIFDPLDGTREFARHSDEFCVCIALVEKNYPKFGIIISPTKGEIICGGREIGSFCFKVTDFIDGFENFNELEPYRLNKLISKDQCESIIMSHFEKSKSLTAFTDHLKNLNKELNVIKMGSAMKFFELVKGNADVYPRFAPTMEWDIAAGQAILEGVGGTVINSETGMRLNYNKESLYNQPFTAKGKILNS